MKVLGFLKEQQNANRISKQFFCNEANTAGRQPLTNWNFLFLIKEIIWKTNMTPLTFHTDAKNQTFLS
jgi:hypothetical protein